MRLIFLILFILFSVGVGIWQVFDLNPDNASAVKQYPYDNAPNYELPTDLDPDSVDLANTRQYPSLTYGVHAFLWWNDWTRNHALDAVNVMRFSHVRQSFAWQDIEPERRDANLSIDERYQWEHADEVVADAGAKNIKLLARIDHAPSWAIRSDFDYDEIPFDEVRLAEYCSALSTRYKGQIQAYQIWNEPNLSREWGNHVPSPVAYAKLLTVCSDAIRAADPDAIIVSAGLSPTGTRNAEAMPDEEFLWKLYAIDGFAESFDVLGVHAPGFAHSPETDPADVVEAGGLRWQCFRHVEHIRAIMVANGDATKQIAITEMGWTVDEVNPDYAWYRVDLETQADYLVRAYAYAAENWRPWIGLMVTIYLPDAQWTPEDEQYWWALGTPAPAPFIIDYRPSFRALADMAKISTEPDYNRPQLIKGVPVTDTDS